jgi:hypothetical protein
MGRPHNDHEERSSDAATFVEARFYTILSFVRERTNASLVGVDWL